MSRVSSLSRTSRAGAAILARLSLTGLAVLCLSTTVGCRKQPESSRGSSTAATGSPSPAERPVRGGAAAAPMARPMPRPLKGGFASGGVVKGLLGLWGLARVTVGGMSVPLPKHFRIRLRFLPRGKLVVIGVKRTKPTRSEGTWEVRGKRLLSTVDGKRERSSWVLCVLG